MFWSWAPGGRRKRSTFTISKRNRQKLSRTEYGKRLIVLIPSTVTLLSWLFNPTEFLRVQVYCPLSSSRAWLMKSDPWVSTLILPLSKSAVGNGDPFLLQLLSVTSGAGDPSPTQAKLIGEPAVTVLFWPLILNSGRTVAATTIETRKARYNYHCTKAAANVASVFPGITSLMFLYWVF